VFPFAIDAVVHCVPEILVGPTSDACLLVRSDIGRVDRAEGRRHGAPAGERLPAFLGVAGLAVARVDQVTATHDLAVQRRRVHVHRDRGAECAGEAEADGGGCGELELDAHDRDSTMVRRSSAVRAS
jgi:hypothetical protein